MRLAMTHAACDPGQLDSELFAYMTAGAYTAEEVEAETQVRRFGGRTTWHRKHLQPFA